MKPERTPEVFKVKLEEWTSSPFAVQKKYVILCIDIMMTEFICLKNDISEKNDYRQYNTLKS